MLKKIIALLLISVSYTHSITWNLTPRLSLGPGWFKFYSFENYDLTELGINSLIPQSQLYTTNFDLMPYFDGRIRGFIGQHFNLQLLGSGGLLRDGQAFSVNYFLIQPDSLLPISNDLTYKANIVTADVQAGFHYNVGCYLSFNPVFGYIYNKQIMAATFAGVSNSVRWKNIWKAPYAGLELGLKPFPCLQFLALYKLAFGKVQAIISAHNPSDSTLVLPDGKKSLRCGNMLGNIFGFEVLYNFFNHWRIGTNINYSHYMNRKKIKASISYELSSLETKATLHPLLWEQLTWLLFVEYDF